MEQLKVETEAQEEHLYCHTFDINFECFLCISYCNFILSVLVVILKSIKGQDLKSNCRNQYEDGHFLIQ